MTQHRHEEQQLPSQAVAEHAQGMASALESSVAMNSEEMAQLASQVQSTMGTSQQMQVANTPQPALQMNPNATKGKIAPLQAQLQNNQVVAAMSAVPVMWQQGAPIPGAPMQGASIHRGSMPRAPMPGAPYQIPQLENHAMIPQSQQTAPPMEQQHSNALAISTLPNIMSTSSIVKPDDDVDSQERKKAEKPKGKSKKKGSTSDKPPEEKSKTNRDRNREHARSTRLRKKAYVLKLKEMAQGLQGIQTEEIRQRRVAVQKMMVQKIRRHNIQTVLRYHSNYESDVNKWAALLDESFWFKQPVTPFRSFRRSDVVKDCRILRGVDAMICDAASVSCMIERVGFRNSRWQQIKRKEFFKGTISIQNMMESELDGTLQAESSLSSASSADSSCSSSAGETPTKRDHHTLVSDYTNFKTGEAKRVTSSSESNNGHSEAATRKTDDSDSSAARNIAKASFSTAIEAATWNEPSQRTKRQKGSHSFQTAKIAQSGGVVHEVVSQPMNMTLHANFELAPSGFTGASNLIMSTVDLLSNNVDEIGANYAVNKDDMIMIDDVLMCPFVFRSKNAVLCGALTDCVMPGMLRANFNKANKLTSLELIYDAMGFMQQLDGASGGEVAAQVIPGSLEMALVHGTSDARVVTEAKPPFCVVHVNEPWTRLTKYSQLEVEGRGLLSLIEGEGTDPEARVRPGKPHHKFEDVAKGRCACSTNIHNDKFGNPFVDFMCSYPLTNAADEISHLLHVNQELPRMKLV